MLQRDRAQRQLTFADGSHAAGAVPAHHVLLQSKHPVNPIW